MARMSRTRRFLQVDVFSAVPTRGNALAVVVDGDGLEAETMQRFAVWTNLSETTFLLPPEDASADYRVRIFTPTHEMRFAGHPTLGSCVSWLHAGGVPREAGTVRQECPIGIVEVDVSGAAPAFVAPPTEIAPMAGAEREAIATGLGIAPDRVVDAVRLDNGPDWALLELAAAADVLAVDSARAAGIEIEPHSLGLIGRQEAGADTDYEVRMFAPRSNIAEDPITGSLNAAIAHWLAANGRLRGDLVVAQGTRIGRLGRVHVRPDPGDASRIAIGGEVHVLVDGRVTL